MVKQSLHIWRSPQKNDKSWDLKLSPFSGIPFYDTTWLWKAFERNVPYLSISRPIQFASSVPTIDSSVPTFVEVGRAQKWSSSKQNHPRIVSDNSETS